MDLNFTAEELADAKSGLLRYRKLWRAQNAWSNDVVKSIGAPLTQRTSLEGDEAAARRVDDALAGVTLEQVNAVARRFLIPANWRAGQRPAATN